MDDGPSYYCKWCGDPIALYTVFDEPICDCKESFEFSPALTLDDEMETERDRLDRLAADLAAANATLDKMRVIIPPPGNMYYCMHCQEFIVPTADEYCETCDTYVDGEIIEALQNILYPQPEKDNE